MKKILHITHTDVKSDSRILKEINSLQSCPDYHITSIGINLEEGNQSSSVKNYIALNLSSKKIKYIPKPLKHLLMLIELLIKTLIAVRKQKFDVIHCHDTLVLPIGVLLAIFKKSKVIYDAHELESNKNGLSRFLGKATYFIEKCLWKRVDALITVSPSIESWYIEQFGAKKSTVILNSPSFQSSNSMLKENYLKKHFNISNNYPIFIYVGILGQGRGIEMINQAFLSSKVKSNLVYLGYGPLFKELETLAQQNNNIYLHPAVKHDDVVPIISSADYGLCLIENVSLSDYYCLPNKLFEYSFAGLKILASDFPDLANVVKEYNLGICCDVNKDSMIQAIQKIEQNEVNFEDHTKSLHELSWDAQSEKLLNLYHELLY